MRWTTVDLLWPKTAAYGYSGSRPTQLVDPSGLDPKKFGGKCDDCRLFDSSDCEGRYKCCLSNTDDMFKINALLCNVVAGGSILACLGLCLVSFGTACILCLIALGVLIACVTALIVIHNQAKERCDRAKMCCRNPKDPSCIVVPLPKCPICIGSSVGVVSTPCGIIATPGCAYG